MKKMNKKMKKFKKRYKILGLIKVNKIMINKKLVKKFIILEHQIKEIDQLKNSKILN